MERRDFVKNCFMLCGAVTALPIMLQSCKGIHYVTAESTGKTLKLNKTEFFDENKKARKFVVLKAEKLQFPICIYKADNNYNAVYMQCTHQGCELQPNKTSLVCPCHGSEFSTAGKVLSAPADKDLQQFKITSDNEIIYIEI